MRLIRQTIRGCRTLPHVGEHPGTAPLVICLLLGAWAGANGGIYGCLRGVTIMGLFVVPCYLFGAYGRAQESDRMVRKGEP